jgi:hypothetical protein
VEKVWTIRSRGTHGGNPSSLGETTPGGTIAQEFETPKVWRAKVNSGHRIQGGHTSTDRVLPVEVLQEEASEESLKLSKPKEMNSIAFVNL